MTETRRRPASSLAIEAWKNMPPEEGIAEMGRLRAENEHLREQEEEMLDKNDGLKNDFGAVCHAIIKAHDSMFVQCCSNPVFNQWGKQVDVTDLNNAEHLAREALLVHGDPDAPKPEGIIEGKKGPATLQEHLGDCIMTEEEIERHMFRTIGVERKGVEWADKPGMVVVCESSLKKLEEDAR